MTYKTNLTVDENIGLLSYESNLIAKNFDVDKHSNSFINNLNWQSNLWVGKSGAENQLLSDVKLVNYRSQNVKKFKNDQDNTEIYGAVGYLTKLPFFKQKTAYEIHERLVGSEMCIRDRIYSYLLLSDKLKSLYA